MSPYLIDEVVLIAKDLLECFALSVWQALVSSLAPLPIPHPIVCACIIVYARIKPAFAVTVAQRNSVKAFFSNLHIDLKQLTHAVRKSILV